MYRTAFRRNDDGRPGLCVEADKLEHNPFAARNLLQLLAFRIEKVKVVVAVFLALQYEFAVVPGQECYRCDGMHVLVMVLLVQRCRLVACPCIVAYQFHVGLVAVQLYHVDRLAVGVPCNVGEVSVGRVACFQVYGLAGFQVVNADSDLVAGFACHRIFGRQQGGYACVDVDQGIVGHHALVHTVEGQLLSVGTPECAFIYSELVAVYRLGVNNVVAAVSGYLAGYAFSVGHIKVVVLDEGNGA